MKIIGKLISILYWKFGRKYDDNVFWTRVVVYHIRNTKVDGKYVVAQLNEITGQLDHKIDREYASRFPSLGAKK